MSGDVMQFKKQMSLGGPGDIEPTDRGRDVALLKAKLEASQTETPWRVVCREHGPQFLTRAAYFAQMEDHDDLWRCPCCGRLASFDDKHYDAVLDATARSGGRVRRPRDRGRTR